MTSALNIQLTDELRRFVDARASDDDLYSTPSEYVRDLIRRDMENKMQQQERAIADMLLAARQTRVTPLAPDFIEKERRKLSSKKARR